MIRNNVNFDDVYLDEKLIKKSIKRFCRPQVNPNFLKNLLRTRSNKKIKKIGCTDSSDGLFQAIQDLATASNCKAIINYDKVPKDIYWPKGDNWDEYYFFGGEDYELVFSLPEKWAKNLSKLDKNINEIGFFVDAGVSYHLSRLPHQVGCWMALTGLSIDADDCCALGLSAFKIAINDYDSVLNALQRTDWGQDPHNTVDIILQSFHQKPDKSLVMQHAPLIADIFQSDRLATITDRILQSTDDWLQATQQALSYNSPNSMQCSLWQMRQAQSVNFDEVIDMDLVLAKKFYAIPDFKEGIRALLIDKDYSPHWQQHSDWAPPLP